MAPIRAAANRAEAIFMEVSFGLCFSDAYRIAPHRRRLPDSRCQEAVRSLPLELASHSKEASVPAVVFLPFLTLPLLAAFFLDTDLFALFLVMFCVVGGLCTASDDPLARSPRRTAQRRPQTPQGRDPVPTGTPEQDASVTGFRASLDENYPSRLPHTAGLKDARSC
jgi:hypothetical protein